MPIAVFFVTGPICGTTRQTSGRGGAGRLLYDGKIMDRGPCPCFLPLRHEFWLALIASLMSFTRGLGRPDLKHTSHVESNRMYRPSPRDRVLISPTEPK